MSNPKAYFKAFKLSENKLPLEKLLTQAVKLYAKEFKRHLPIAAALAPGRAIFFGDCTDPSKPGTVLAMALPLVTIVVGGKNPIEKCVVAIADKKNTDKPLKVQFPIPSVQECKPGKPQWANYVKGVVQNFKGYVPGFNAIIIGNVPLGGGLSSSASLEVAVYTFLEALTGKITGTLEKILLCQKAEHEFAGVPCGIMDQFVAVNARKGCALLLDCKTNEGTDVPFEDPDLCVIIANSNVKHELAKSKYPERRKECETAAAILKKDSLRDATLSEVEKVAGKLDASQYKRARHVVTEIERTREAARALEESNIKRFGELMYASHESLRDDFEVSCKELDDLVEAARSVEGVLGSRMTGGGFGGCTVTLAPKAIAKDIIKAMKKRMKIKPTFYIVEASVGAQALEIPRK